MDMFAFARQEAQTINIETEDWRTTKHAKRDQPAQLTCDGCGIKGPVIVIPTDRIPQELWKVYVLEHSKWKDECPACEVAS
jgi:hypothetical protein